MTDEINMSKFIGDEAQEIVDFRLPSFRSPLAGMNLPAEQVEAINKAYLRFARDCAYQAFHSNDVLLHLMARASTAEKLAKAAAAGEGEKHLAAELAIAVATANTLRGQLAAIHQMHGILPPPVNQPAAAPAATPKPPAR